MEFKFRLFDTESKTMVPWSYASADYELGLILCGEFKGLKVMQYTGFKDKDGKEIFQGDIVEYNFKSLNEKTNKTRVSEVYLNDFRRSWSVYASVDNSSNNDLFKYIRNGNVVKVIGNIYENPELFKRP